MTDRVFADTNVWVYLVDHDEASKRDIARSVLEPQTGIRLVTSAQVMTRDVVSCRSDDRVEDVLRMMGERSLVHIPVLEADSRPAGVLEARDALKALMARASYEIWHLRDYIMGAGYR